MKPSEIRSELLAQHADLRVQIAEVRRLAESWEEGGEGSMHHPLVRLTDAVRRHNAREDELMRDVFPTLDAGGPVRAEVMQEEHVLEHGALFASLVLARDTSATASPASVVAVLDSILAHMAREEEVFLGKDVLSDDGVEPDHFGG
jgi:hypothetical protein